MIVPSLTLLLIKTVGIFLLSWIAGWSVCWRRTDKNIWISWLIVTVVGSAALNLTVTTAIILGFPGIYGPLFLLFICLIKLIYNFKSFYIFNISEFKEFLYPFIFICGLVVCSYFAPFFSQSTSGLYSRGGGDHSTYLALSEYFQYQSLWDKIEKVETSPPLPYWETKISPYFLQNLFSEIKIIIRGEWQPLGNQMIASPYMSLLPGEVDETYSATVAFYTAVAASSVVAFLYTLVGGWRGVAWLAFIPIGLSNLLLYPSGTHSIPFLFAIAIFNISLLLAWQKTRISVDARHLISYIPPVICGGGLLTIYPFLFVALYFFYVIFALMELRIYRIKNYLWLGLIVLIGSLVISHFYLLINIPLVLIGASTNNSLYHPFSLLQLISTQSGLIDFLMLPSGGTLSTQAKFSILAVMFAMALSLFGFLSRRGSGVILFVTVMCVFLSGAAYYDLKDAGGGGGYQMVRLATLSHLYLLSLAGLGLVALLRGTRFQFYLALILIMAYASFAVTQRAAIVHDVVSIPHAFSTEFRDSEAFQIRTAIQELQKIAADKGKSRVAYYYGHGDGTDFAGSTVFMRPLYALNAFNLESILQASSGKKLWDKAWLDNAILVYSPIEQREIINDKRRGATVTPLLSSKRHLVVDTSSQNISAVMGESWNYPIPYDIDGERHSFRYLRGRSGALVIWSNQYESLNLSIKGSADAVGAKLLVRDLQNQTEKSLPMNVWKGNYRDSHQTTVFHTNVKISPGPNVFELAPISAIGVNPWLLIFEINIEDSLEYDIK